MVCLHEFLHEPYMKLTRAGEINAPAAFLRDRRRQADSRLHLDPGAGRRFALERTGERMIGAAHRHTDAKKWHVVSSHSYRKNAMNSFSVPVITPSAGQDRSSHSARVSCERRGAD